MQISRGLAGAVLLASCAIASAHTHLKAAVPAKDSTVSASPEKISLTFSGPARATALAIQKEGGEEQKLGPLPPEPSTQISVPAPKLAPGKYTVVWRVMGSDNHVMSGKYQFTVGGS